MLMGFLRMFDCYRDVPLTFKMFGTMFTKWNVQIFWDGSLMNLNLSLADYGVLLTGVLTLLLAFPVRRLVFGRRLNAPVMKTAPVVFKRA